MVAPTSHYDRSHAVPHSRSAPDLIRRVFLATSVYRQRRALSRLDDDALRDIGLTRIDAETEAARPFWDVPSTWRR